MDSHERGKWFRDNSKLVLVRYKDVYQGNIIGVFQDDKSALNYLEKRMEQEGKSLVLLEMIWLILHGYTNACNNTYNHKFIKNACFREINGARDTEINFWFEIIDNKIDWHI